MSLFAHAGGWDELAMFGIPIVTALVALRFVEKRAKAKAAERDASQDGTETRAAPLSDGDP